MGRNFDAPKGETEESRTADRGKSHKLGRIAALALAISGGAAVIALPSDAEAQTGLSVNFVKFVGTAKGKIVNGVFMGDAIPDGWFTDTKITIEINLERIFTKEFLKELEGQDVEFELDGEIKNGVYTGEVTPKGHVLIGLTPRSYAQPDCTPRPSPRSCDKPANCKGSVRRSAAKPARPLAPEPGESESGLVRLKKPFDSGTFYVDKPEAGKSMGEGHPRGFDVEKDESITFFVTGDPSENTRVSIELYPWVPSDEKKRAAAESLKVKITIDGEEFEMLPQPLPKGKILPSSKTGEEGLWDTPLRLQQIPVPPGTHEIVVIGAGSHFRTVLRGAAETVKPSVDAAIERPFQEDPDFPPEFDMNARLVTAAEEPSGYRLEPITKSPVKLDRIQIERIQNSTLVRVRLVMDDVTYESEKPLMPHTDHRVRFTRTTPPARSTDSEGPDELPLHVTAEGKVDASIPLPIGMTCQTRRTNLFCSQVSEDESRVRAYRTRLDTRPTNPAGKPRHHILRKY